MSIQPGVTFRAWRIAENDRHEADPIAMAVKNLPDAIGAALRHCAHKDAFVVETHDHINAKRTLQFFRVRQKARTWRFNVETKQSEVFNPIFADALFSMAVNAFDPVEPWRWAPGADVVGHDAGLIEGRAA